MRSQSLLLQKTQPQDTQPAYDSSRHSLPNLRVAETVNEAGAQGVQAASEHEERSTPGGVPSGGAEQLQAATPAETEVPDGALQGSYGGGETQAPAPPPPPLPLDQSGTFRDTEAQEAPAPPPPPPPLPPLPLDQSGALRDTEAPPPPPLSDRRTSEAARDLSSQVLEVEDVSDAVETPLGVRGPLGTAAQGAPHGRLSPDMAAERPHDTVLLTREGCVPDTPECHAQRVDVCDESSCGHEETTSRKSSSSSGAERVHDSKQAPMPWTIPLSREDRPASSSSWTRSRKPPIDFSLFSPLPLGDDSEAKELRRQLFDVMDMSGSGRLSLAELTRGVREVLQLDDVFGECKHAVMSCFRVGALGNDDDRVSRRTFRDCLLHLQTYIDLYALFHSLTVGDTVTVQAFCSATNYLRSQRIPVSSCPEIDFANVTGDNDVMSFSEFAGWVVEGRVASNGSPHRRQQRSRSPPGQRSYSRSPSPPQKGLRMDNAQPHTKSVQHGINSGGGGGDWTVRFYQQKDVLGAYGDIHSVHSLLDDEAGGMPEGSYLVLKADVAEALFPVVTSLAVSKEGHIKKMIARSYAQVLFTDPEVRKLFMLTYEKTLRCLGIEADLSTGEVVNEAARFHVLVARRVTHFRKLVTRILHSLGTFGLSNFRVDLLSLFVDEITRTRAMESCRDVCRSQWLPVLEEGRAKDELYSRLNAVVKRKPVGSGVSAVRKQQRREIMRRGRSPLQGRQQQQQQPQHQPQQQQKRSAGVRGKSRSPSPSRKHPDVQQRVPLHHAPPQRDSTPYQQAAPVTPQKSFDEQPQRTSKWLNPEKAGSFVPIRLEEDEDAFRLVVLGTPDRVRVTVNLLSLHIRVVPAEAESGVSAGSVLINDLEDYTENATRDVHLSTPVAPHTTSKAAWGTRHTVFRIAKMPNNTAEL